MSFGDPFEDSGVVGQRLPATRIRIAGKVDLTPASIHHEYDSSPGRWSR